MVPVTTERSDQKTPALPLWLAKEMVPVKFERALHARSNTKPKINLKGAPGFFPGLWALRSSEAQGNTIVVVVVYSHEVVLDNLLVEEVDNQEDDNLVEDDEHIDAK
ncbi:hypothetical protein L7F22_018964 [Adiantum nelumboides]|nr:hypothetical protein [Adiantum nelumboides]